MLIVGGDADQHATLAETRLIYANANAPKDLWIIPSARHQDFQHFAPAEYERRVVDSLRARLRS